jgi:hypothetical protein
VAGIPDKPPLLAERPINRVDFVIYFSNTINNIAATINRVGGIVCKGLELCSCRERLRMVSVFQNAGMEHRVGKRFVMAKRIVLG